jgi:predicted secreted Zn-dependent protease
VNYIIRLLLAIVLLSNSLVSVAEVKVNEKVKYYTVAGNSATALRSSLNQRSPIKTKAGTFDGYTRWYVEWRFNWRESESSCAITRVTTQVDVTFTLPKWHGTTSNQVLENRWNNYYNSLVSHENGHKAFAINAAKKIERVLTELKPYDSCSELEKQANQLGHQILKDYIKQEKRYDVDTNHGLTQGAKFP